MSLIDAVLTEAGSWLGYLEKKRPPDSADAYDEDYLIDKTKHAGRDNYTIFAKWYRDYFGIALQAEPWCAMFVSDVFYRALGADVQQALLPHFAGCTTGTRMFKKMGIWVENNPKRGDLILFKYAPDPTTQGHVGLVTDVKNGRAYTIEGNTSAQSGVVANGGAVVAKSYALSYNMIAGYARPRYEDFEGELTMTQYEELKGMIEALSERVDALEQKVNVPVYNTVEELPVWAQSYVQQAIDRGYLGGTGGGKLNLTDELVRAVVIMMRAMA